MDLLAALFLGWLIGWAMGADRLPRRRPGLRPEWFAARYLPEDLQVPAALGFIAVGVHAIWWAESSGAATPAGRAETSTAELDPSVPGLLAALEPHPAYSPPWNRTRPTSPAVPGTCWR